MLNKNKQGSALYILVLLNVTATLSLFLLVPLHPTPVWLKAGHPCGATWGGVKWGEVRSGPEKGRANTFGQEAIESLWVGANMIRVITFIILIAKVTPLELKKKRKTKFRQSSAWGGGWGALFALLLQPWVKWCEFLCYWNEVPLFNQKVGLAPWKQLQRPFLEQLPVRQVLA